MLNSKDVKLNIMELLTTDESKRTVGSRVNGQTMSFDSTKLAERRQEIATILTELGIHEQPKISLKSLAAKMSGEVWNELQTAEDIEALDLLLACSDACGFINNGATTVSDNINGLGALNATLLSPSGRAIVGNDTIWARLVRERIADNVSFYPAQDKILEYAIASQATVVPTVR